MSFDAYRAVPSDGDQDLFIGGPAVLLVCDGWSLGSAFAEKTQGFSAGSTGHEVFRECTTWLLENDAADDDEAPSFALAVDTVDGVLLMVAGAGSVSVDLVDGTAFGLAADLARVWSQRLVPDGSTITLGKGPNPVPKRVEVKSATLLAGGVTLVPDAVRRAAAGSPGAVPAVVPSSSASDSPSLAAGAVVAGAGAAIAGGAAAAVRAGVDTPDVEAPSADLADVDLPSADLSDVDLPDAELGNVDLPSADLGNVDLPNVDLPNVDLPGADLGNVDLPNVDLPNVDLPGADLPDVDLASADLGNVDLPSADLVNVDLPNVDLPGADLGNVDLPNVDLPNVDLPGADLGNVDLPNVDLPSADLGNVDLPNVDLPGADLGNVDLPGADLGNVDLPNVDLPSADLGNVDLPNVDLPGADLGNVDLPNVDLPGADLGSVDLPGVDLPNAGVPDVELPGADLGNLNLPDVDLPSAGVPDIDAPNVDLPSIGSPDLEVPRADLPDLDLPSGDLAAPDVVAPGSRVDLAHTQLPNVDLSHLDLPKVDLDHELHTPELSADLNAGIGDMELDSSIADEINDVPGAGRSNRIGSMFGESDGFGSVAPEDISAGEDPERAGWAESTQVHDAVSVEDGSASDAGELPKVVRRRHGRSGAAIVADPSGSMIEGIVCESGHVNAPGWVRCATCGASLAHAVDGSGPHPGLGIFEFEDGTTATIDSSYLLGRRPDARAIGEPDLQLLVVTDDSQSVSRNHVIARVDGWDLYLIDYGSANGTHVEVDNDLFQLVPGEPYRLADGQRVLIGTRWFEYKANGR